VFLSGGLSEPEVEANFTGSPKLGRSVMALDVYSGQVLAAVDSPPPPWAAPRSVPSTPG